MLFEQLPKVSDCLQAIVNVSPSYGFVKQKEAIHNFATSLHNLWAKSFTQKHVIIVKDERVKLTDQLKIYATKIQKTGGN